MKKLKEFNKTELNDLKFAIVMNGIKNHFTVFDYMDELVSEYNLDERARKYCIPFLKRFMIILMRIDVLWLSHFSGRSREYVHVEKLCNLDKLVHSNLPKLQKIKFPKFQH